MKTLDKEQYEEFKAQYGKEMYNTMNEIYINNDLPEEAKTEAHDSVIDYLKFVAEEAKAEHRELNMPKLLWQALAREQVLMYLLKPYLKAQEESIIDYTDTDYLLGAMLVEKIETEEDKKRCRLKIKRTMANEFAGNILMPEDMENAYNNIIGYLQELGSGKRSAKGEHWRLLVRCEAFKCWAKHGIRRGMLVDPKLSESEKAQYIQSLETEFNRM